MKNMIIFTIAVFIITISSSLHAEEIKIVLTIKEQSKVFKIAQKVIQQIAQKMEVDISLVYMPRKRATYELINGNNIAADLARIAEFSESNTSLIRVNEPIVQWKYFVYANKKIDFRVKGWESLKSYSIVYVRGTKLIDVYLKKHKKLHDVSTTEHAFKFLAANRADLFISTPSLANPILNTAALKNKGIKILYPAIHSVPLYTFFNKRNEQHVERFNKALISIKKDGTYNKIVKSILTQ